MGVSGLKKHSINQTAQSSAADDFISGARVDGQNYATTKTPLAKVYKRITFSLTDELDVEIDRLSLVTREFRASRSDVIRAAVALLASQGDAEVAKLLNDSQSKK